MAETYEGYCVKCKEKRQFEGEVRVSDSGRRMAQGLCPRLWHQDEPHPRQGLGLVRRPTARRSTSAGPSSCPTPRDVVSDAKGHRRVRRQGMSCPTRVLWIARCAMTAVLSRSAPCRHHCRRG